MKRGCRILVIDDNPVDRQIHSEFVARRSDGGVQITEGSDALTFISRKLGPSGPSKVNSIAGTTTIRSARACFGSICQ